MRKRLLCLVMALCLLFSLAGCSSGGEAEESPVPSTEVSPEATQSEPAEATEPEAEKETEPVEEETPTEPEEEETGETDPGNADSADFLALLKEEYEEKYESGTLTGKSRDHIYYPGSAFNQGAIVDDMIYFVYRDDLYSFDRNTKELTVLEWYRDASWSDTLYYYLDGQFYFRNKGNVGGIVNIYSADGQKVASAQLPGDMYSIKYTGDGFFCFLVSEGSCEACVLSKDFEILSTVPAPEIEVEHGITEPVELIYNSAILVDRSVFVMDDQFTHLYRLDLGSDSWIDSGELDEYTRDYMISLISGDIDGSFFGRYYYNYDDNIFDITTGETVYEVQDGVYPKYYFGGDTCITRDWKVLNLKDGSVSDSLKLPEKTNSWRIFNDTDYIYSDQYGFFLWNLNTGEEETIMLFE